MKAKNLLYLAIYVFAQRGVAGGNFPESQIPRGDGTRQDIPLSKTSDWCI